MKWAWPQKVPRAGERGVIAGEKQSMHPVSPESDSCVEGRRGRFFWGKNFLTLLCFLHLATPFLIFRCRSPLCAAGRKEFAMNCNEVPARSLSHFVAVSGTKDKQFNPAFSLLNSLTFPLKKKGTNSLGFSPSFLLFGNVWAINSDGGGLIGLAGIERGGGGGGRACEPSWRRKSPIRSVSRTHEPAQKKGQGRKEEARGRE